MPAYAERRNHNANIDVRQSIQYYSVAQYVPYANTKRMHKLSKFDAQSAQTEHRKRDGRTALRARSTGLSWLGANFESLCASVAQR